MPNDLTPSVTVTLRLGRLTLPAVEGGDSYWIGEDNLVTPLGFSDARSLKRIRAKNTDLFNEKTTAFLPVMTAGGVQSMLHYSLLGTLFLAQEAGTAQARAIRTDLALMMNGQRPVPRLKGEHIRSIADIAARLDHPMIVAAWEKSRLIATRERAHRKELNGMREEVRRLGRLGGLRTEHLEVALKMLDTAAAITAGRVQPLQPQLPFEGA